MPSDFDTLIETSEARRRFGVKVREKRHSLEMDQRDLAEEASCLLHQVHQIEAGTCHLPGVMRRVAEVLGLEVAKVQA
jgi:transcriptional regulator with XRE-family HTH domain